MKSEKSKVKSRGFTLIELLVVIAVIGILAAAMIVLINPLKRMQDTRDANRKQIVSSTANAMEACYSKNEGSFANCDTIAKLVSDGFIKQDPTRGDTQTWATDTGCVSVELENPASSGAPYWKYTTGAGKAAASTDSCGAVTPTATPTPAP